MQSSIYLVSFGGIGQEVFPVYIWVVIVLEYTSIVRKYIARDELEIFHNVIASVNSCHDIFGLFSVTSLVENGNLIKLLV
jgi:hypothetical protein